MTDREDSEDIGYFIQPPMDEYGNTGCPYAVIKARVTPAAKPYLTDRLHVLEPKEIRDVWPTFSVRFWRRLEGVTIARMLTRAEWKTLTGFEGP